MPFSESNHHSSESSAESTSRVGNQPSEQRLAIEKTVAKCQRGDPDGQRDLFERFHRRVFRLAVRMVGDRDAADITQDVFFRIFQKIRQFQGKSRFETWLHRITVNECLQFIRRNKRQTQQLVQEPTAKRLSANEQLEQRELLELAMKRLDPELRAIFLLREVEDLNYAEIAEAVQIPEGTVASRLNRARRQLRDILSELGWEVSHAL